MIMFTGLLHGKYLAGDHASHWGKKGGGNRRAKRAKRLYMEGKDHLPRPPLGSLRSPIFFPIGPFPPPQTPGPRLESTTIYT